MQPLKSPQQQEFEYSFCSKCGGFGFTGPIPVTGGGWIAKDVFEHGVPCSCPAGREFRQMQAEWFRE